MADPDAAAPSGAELVLVVDDDDVGRYAKVRILRRAGYEVIEAATGNEGLRLATERRPALVMLDVKLPDVSGLDVCEAIKRDHAGIMVLQTSASFVTSEDRIRGLDGGADNYLTQPIDSRELVAAVRALLRLRTAEQGLRASEERYRLILESATDYAIVTTDLSGRITTWNTGARNVLGWDAGDVLGRDVRVIWTPEDRAAGVPEAEMRAALEHGRAIDERWHLREDGTRFWAAGLLQPMRDADGEARGFLKILRDRTEQRRFEDERERVQAELQHLNETLEQRVADEVAERLKAEEALRQAQKMEAVGQLTGGIAHDFNNLLTGIVGALGILQRRIGAGRTEGLERYTGLAVTSAQRAAALTQRLLAFARRQPLDPRPVDANRLLAGMEDLLRRTLGPVINLEMVLAGGLWPTLCDPNQLESAILNLAINARDAMPEGGRLTVETANTHLDDAYARGLGEEVRPGQYVALCVTDTGTGMSPEVIARAFEPFFTTKPIGQGTGLGLSMLYGFVRQSGGNVRIYSEPGQGTTVKLYLPRYLGKPEPPETAAAVPSVPRADAGETVLVVEDEAAVRMLIVETLGELGYAALEASDGPSGLRLLQSDVQVDLLVTDVGLPGLNGRQLADAARELRPGLKVLFITGYAHNAALGNGILEAGTAMMTKPFAMDALSEKIRSMLDHG